MFKQKQYKNDAGNTLDRVRTQPKGNEVFNVVRHKTAQIAGPPTYIETWPVDSQDDAEAAKDAKRVLQQVIHDPLKRYRLRRRAMVAGALVASTWYMKAEWVPSIGPFGGMRFSTRSPMQLLPAPGYTDIHDPLCPHLTEWADVPMASITGKRGWKNTRDLWPDNKGRYETEEDYQKSQGRPRADEQYGPDTVRVAFKWIRADATTDVKPGLRHRVLPDGRQPGEADERYMQCPCGYRTMDHPRDETGALPLSGGLCPLCYESVPQKMSPMVRIDAERTDEHMLRYPNGRLIIFAPTQRRIFYDGPWPERTRSFPFFQFRAYENPEEYHGQNDAALHWSHQVILNSLRRMGYEQMRTSKRVFIVAGGPDGKGLLDSRGRPFVISDENGFVAYTGGQTTQGMISEFQGQGLPSSFPVYYNIIHGAVQSTLGISDLGLTAANSKDIAASTVRQLTQMGEIPVADHKDVLNEEEGVFLGCVLDIEVEHMDVPKAVRYFGLEGETIIRRLRASDIPNVDVMVTAQPTLRSEQIEDLKVFQQWAQLLPPIRRIAARRLGLAPSEIAEFEAETLKMQQTQPPLPVPGGAGGPAPTGLPAGMAAPSAAAM